MSVHFTSLYFIKFRISKLGGLGICLVWDGVGFDTCSFALCGGGGVGVGMGGPDLQ